MLNPGQRIGEYVLEERLGQSAYAEVWRAHHHMWADQVAAIKIPTDQNYINNLRQEGIRVARLVHANIVRPVGFDPLAQPPYLATEYIAGSSLRPWIAEKRLNDRQAANILRQILQALQFAHERGIIHGDIKPENVLLDEEADKGFADPGSVKVTDFGVGLAVNKTLTCDPAAKSGAAAPLLAYLAPEQRGGAMPPDVKSDLYAAGVILFEMLTGQLPKGAELPSELNPKVPRPLDDLYRKSHTRPDRRFDSARNFLEALDAANPPAHKPAPPPAPHPVEAEDEDGPIAIATEDDDVVSPYKPTVVHEPPEKKKRAEGIIGFQDGEDDDDDVADAPAVETPKGEDELGIAEEPRRLLGEEDEEEEAPATPEDQEPGEDAAAAARPRELGPSEPPAPAIPRVPSRADRQALFDELVKRQIRTTEDLRVALKQFVDVRDLDEGETVNIHLRLVKWANALAGPEANLDDQIVLSHASMQPLYIVKMLMRTTRGDEDPKSVTLEHPIGQQASQALHAGDYRLIIHFSADSLNEKLLDTLPNTALRVAVMHMARDGRREFFGRILREDLLIWRANVIVANYRFDGRKFRAFMVGNSLSVVSAGEPFTKIRQEPTKRAAQLLDGEQIHQGIKELRRGLESPQWETKSGAILSALRGKLAAAYMVEARKIFEEYGWLESLEQSSKAGQLSPGNEDALAHARLVRSRVSRIQVLPGLCIAAIFVGLAVLWTRDTWSSGFQAVIVQLLESTFFAAGIAALIATLWSWRVLRTRMARTDFAFYQAALLPTAVAGIVAAARFQRASTDNTFPWIIDVICGVLLIAVIVVDVWIFKKYRSQIFRQVQDPNLIGDGLTLLNRIDTMLQQDWDFIKPHYLAQNHLYTFASAQVTAGAAPELFEQSTEDDSALPPELDETHGPPPPRRASTGDEGTDKMTAQVNSRLSAAARSMVPAARMLVTLIGEYSKSVNNRQLGMMQAHAAKIEQKAKDLTDKLADFERLCRSPLGMDADGGAADLAERANDPDIQLLRTMAERASIFRENQSGAISELSGMVDQATAAIERLKKM
jgi:serine/threonine protein kinase